MNDLDTQALRQALRAPADPGLDADGPVDVTRIMARGRRLRQRRRVAAVTGCLCAAAVLAGTATAIVNLTAAPPARLQPASPGGHRRGGQPPALSSHGPSPMRKQAVPVRVPPTPSAPRPSATRPPATKGPSAVAAVTATAAVGVQLTQSVQPTVSPRPAATVGPTALPTPTASMTPSPTRTATAS